MRRYLITLIPNKNYKQNRNKMRFFKYDYFCFLSANSNYNHK